MEGYSVTEAASVLGVPTERVWELLARGVLSGVPDGESGMRVFLQPRPAPPAVEEPRRSNGGGTGRESEAEASPFRELLSEFRNLTERYGQALLALGESRGEVASLRSRVDLLEARFDLRLPMSGASTAQPSAAAGWNARQPAPGPTVEPIPAEDAAGASPDQEAAEPSPPRRRRRGQHRATDDFAEALARAEDPSPAELPGGEEAAAAFAALRDEAAHRTAEHADAALPRELPAAEPIAIIEPEAIAEVVSQPVAEAGAAAEEAPQPVAEEEVAAEEAPPPVAEVEATAEEAPEPIGTAEVEVAVEEAPEPVGEAPAVEAETVGAEPQLIVDELATAAIEAEAIVDSVPEPIEEAEEPPTTEPEIAFDGLPLKAEPEAEPWFEPGPAAEPEPYAELVMEASSAEPESEPEAAIEAPPEPMAEAPAAPMAEMEGEPEPEPAAGEDSVDAEPEGPVEATSEPVADEPGPVTALQADEEPEEPAEAEPASEWEDAAQAEAEPASEWDDAAQAEPGLGTEVESEPPVEAEPEGLADAEPSWDRDRYTARIEEPDWIPEERSPQPAATTSPETEAPFADARRPEPDSEGSDAEPASPEPPWVGELGTSTPTGEETMLWFGREPNRAAPAWPIEEDSAAEMEVASTGGHTTRPRPAPSEPIAFRPAPAVPPAELPDVRAEYRASLRPQPPSPASRAYRRLRRIFPS